MKKELFRLNLLFFIGLTLLSSCVDNIVPKQQPVALDGVLDCAGWNFDTDGMIELKGGWKWSWLEPDERAALADFDDSTWSIYTVPAQWNDRTGTGYGFGWFRLKLVNIRGSNLGFYLRNTCRSYELYVNGVMLMQNGKPGATREATVHQRLPLFRDSVPGDTLVLAWKVANFSDPFGGLPYAVKFGKTADLKDFFWNEIILQIIAMSVMGIMCLYHFFLWVARRKDFSSLFFAGFCLVLIIRTIALNNYLSLLFPGVDVFELSSKLELLFIPFGWFCLQNFLMRLFPEEYSRKPYRVIFVISIVIVLVTLLLPSFINLYIVFSFPVFVLFAAGWNVFAVVRAIRRKRQAAWFILIGFIILFLTMCNDFLLPMGIVKSLLQFGMVAFIFTQSASLSYRFAQAFKTAEKLSLHLQEEVDRQTGQITAQNRTLLQLNRELEETQREKTNFFISIAHETKTPLTLINNYVRQYIRKHGQSEEMAVIERNVESLLKDMVDFLDLEKIAKGKMLYNHDRIVNLTEILESKAVSFGEPARQRKIALAVKLQKDVHIKIDPAALERIVNNMLDNAIKYNRDKGEIRLSLEARRRKVMLVVEDSGIGISEKQLANIFTPFYQALQTRKNVQGIGIGLSIIKKIMDELGGQILVESALGKGTKFTCVFKQHVLADGEVVWKHASPARIQPRARLPLVKEQAYRKDRHTLLVVEDNPELLAYLVNNLRDNYNVCFAVNGKEALEKLEDAPRPVLVVSDIMMNEMDGYELFERLSRRKDFAGVPFIFLSARTAVDERLQGLAKGALDYITKPFELDELLSKIKTIINNRQALRQQVSTAVKRRIVKEIRQKITEGITRSFEENCRKYAITEKEKEIIRRILDGKIHKEISYELRISHNTVKNHLKRIYHKCQVQTKVELVNCLKAPVSLAQQSNN